MKNRKRLIIILSALTVILIIVTILIEPKSPQKTTLKEEGSIGPTARPAQTAGQELIQIVKKPAGNLEEKERERLEKLKSQLPYRSPDFDMEYSTRLERFFIMKKTASDRNLRVFLGKNDVLELYFSGYSGFIVTTKSFEEAQSQAEEDLKNGIEGGRAESEQVESQEE